MTGIENWLSQFDVGERHEVAMPLPPDQALRLALAVPVAPDRFIRLLLRLRGLGPEGSIEEFMAANRFLLLERTATSYVVGMIAGPGRLAALDPVGWRAANAPGSLKIAADFRTEPEPAGSRLITETRVAANGWAPLLVFRIYWLVVGPFSGLIRRRWLRAAVRDARTQPKSDGGLA
jgi:hypothetical protein